jgi:ribonuclease HI
MAAQIDLTASTCRTCKRGQYCETSLFDNIDGVLHCSACGVQIARYERAAVRYQAYADGSCKNNGREGGGRGGWGVFVREENGPDVAELSGAAAGSTNNKMELTAAIRALQSIPAGAEVELWTDSQYVVRGITEWISGWKKRGWMKGDGSAVLNRDLWQELEAATRRVRVSWHWVRGHDGHEGNERADALAQAAADRG